MTFDEYIAKLETIKANIIGADYSDYIYSALNAAMAAMQRRIFNHGQDADGNSLGEYIGGKVVTVKVKSKSKKKSASDVTPSVALSPYMKKRDKAGLQIGYKDLQFTGSLKSSFVIVKDGRNKAELFLSGEDSVVIAAGQEQQIGNIRAGENARHGTAVPANIFSAGEEEKQLFNKEMQAALNEFVESQFLGQGLDYQRG